MAAWCGSWPRAESSDAVCHREWKDRAIAKMEKTNQEKAVIAVIKEAFSTQQCTSRARSNRLRRARNLIPFPVSPRESRGGDGSPHAAACAAAPPARGLRPLARSPMRIAHGAALRWLATSGTIGRATKKTKDGRHVGLDFYDLLIEGWPPRRP